MNSRVIQTRRVHYFSGFDPRGASYYHRLCEEELLKPQVQGGFLTLGRRQRTGKLFSQWTVKWSADDSSNTNDVQTEHIFMSWDDIIRENWSRNPLVLIKEFFEAYWCILFKVKLSRVKQIFVGVFHTGVLPGAYLLISLLAGVLAGLLFYFLGTTLLRRDLLIFLQLASFLLALFVVERAWRYGNHRGVGWLLRIFTYVVRMGRNGIPRSEQRTREWVSLIIQRQQDVPVEEVLLVGHSIGTLMMVDVVDALLQDPRWKALQNGRPTKVMTLGQCYPFIAMVPDAQAELFRGALKRMSFSPNLLWCDVTAKIDPLCFFQAHPLVKTGIPHESALMPILHSAGFFRMYTATTWAKIRRNKLEAHFLYLRTPELPGNFNLYDILYGPRPFEEHVNNLV